VKVTLGFGRDGALIWINKKRVAAFFLGTPSRLGDYRYELGDTKLARSSRAKFLSQLCPYSEMLAEMQGIKPLQGCPLASKGGTAGPPGAALPLVARICVV
jgi:hypothetical protein